MRKRLPAVALVALMLAPSLVSADDARRASAALFRDAEEAFLDRLYEIALDQFLAAYELFPHPGFHARIGACHLALSEYGKAIESFERFLMEAPDAPNREEVEEMLADARRGLDEELIPLDPLQRDEGASVQLDGLDLSDTSPLSEASPPSPFIPTRPDSEGSSPREPKERTFALLSEHKWAVAVLVGAAAVAGGVAIASARRDDVHIPPFGTLGTVDRR